MSGARNSQRVGVIGAGRMGQPIIGHLVRGGFAVAGHDIDPGKRHAVEDRGARWADTAAAVASDAGVILVCVGYERELRDVVSADLCRRCSPETVIAVLSTVHPHTMPELAQRAEPFSVHVIDATLCRGGMAADDGTLLSFIAGGAEVVERVKPVLACFCTDIVHTGAVGTAQAAKAANNMLMWACLVANHEALALAKRYGLDVSLLRDALLKTGARNGVLERWGTSTMAWADDDLEIVERMARDEGIGLPQAGLTRELCRTLKSRRFQLDEYGV